MTQKLISLFYVSEAVHSLPAGDDPVEAIVEVALARNAALDVTGALVFTGPHFAQLLEGPEAGVEELMTSIRGDPRHRNVNVLQMVETSERRFPDWSLAYAGPSLFVDRHLRPLVEQSTDQRHRAALAESLIDIMAALIAEQGRAA